MKTKNASSPAPLPSPLSPLLGLRDRSMDRLWKRPAKKASPRLVLSVQGIDRHRNGVSGAPFYVILFTTRLGGETADRRMVATVFDAAGHLAVLDRDLLAAGAIEFGGTDEGRNSWRGDHFEAELRAVIAGQEGR